MEILFINQYYSSCEVKKEAFKASNYYKIMLFFPLLLLIPGIFELIDWVHGDRDIFYLWLSFLCFIGMHYGVRRVFENMVRQSLELLGKDPLIYTEIGHDMLITYSPNGHNELIYRNIKKIKVTKNLILLTTYGNVMFLLHKDGFRPVDSRAFLDMMASKGFKIK